MLVIQMPNVYCLAVLKCGMYCSLYEVIGKSKQENSLSGLVQRLEKDRMVRSFTTHVNTL